MSAVLGSDQARGIEATVDVNEVAEHRAAVGLHHRLLEILFQLRPPGGTELTEFDQLFMVLCYFIWPDAGPDEVRCFIFNHTEGDYLDSREEIIERVEELQIFQEHPPKEAFPGLTLESLRNHQYFWTQPPTLGVVTVRRSQLIDFDEFGVEFAFGPGAEGHAGPHVRFRTPGLYTHTMKATVLLAVETGDPNVPDAFRGSVRVWHRIFYQRGVDQVDFSRFVDFVCKDLE
jgi:hypothetical protein